MARLKIDIDNAVAVAKNIQGYNAQMRDAFPAVQSAIARLNGYWDGAASNAAFSKFNELKSNYCDARYNVLNSYTSFLLQQVGQGYTQTEQANISLADQFK